MTVRQGHRVAGVATDPANRDADDFYPTPPEATMALLDVESFDGEIWEPACGDGAISRVLRARGYKVISTDLVDRGYGVAGPAWDFMALDLMADNIVTNPPFKLVTPWLRQAHRMTRRKCALLMRLACLEGQARGEFYRAHPPARVHVFSKRVSIWRRGVVSGSGGLTAFAWFVWDKSSPRRRPELHWI